MADRPVFTIVELGALPPDTLPILQKVALLGWTVVDDSGELRFAYGSLNEAIRRVAALAQAPVGSEEAPKAYGITWRVVFHH